MSRGPPQNGKLRGKKRVRISKEGEKSDEGRRGTHRFETGSLAPRPRPPRSATSGSPRRTASRSRSVLAARSTPWSRGPAHGVRARVSQAREEGERVRGSSTHRVGPDVPHARRLVDAPDGRALPQAPRDRVRLRLNCEAAVAAVGAVQAARDGPRDGLAVELEAQVVVPARRAMVLHDEEVALAELRTGRGKRSSAGARGGRPGRDGQGEL